MALPGTFKRKAKTTVHTHHEFVYQMQMKREEKKMSLSELSRRVGMSGSYMKDIMNGKYAFSMEVGLLICQALDMDIDLLIDYIYTVEKERVHNYIVDTLQQWHESTPVAIRDQMIKGESLYERKEEVMGNQAV